MNSPIVLFVYNRPIHTKMVLESLKKNDLSKESELFIYADGPRKDIPTEQTDKINKTRDVIREKKWCGRVHIVERKENMGLANSVMNGVAEVVDRFGKVIVLEDDLIASRYFLKYMNAALDKYEKEDKVMQISGFLFPIDSISKSDAFFLPLSSSWGWATWKRSWKLFDKEMKGLGILKKNRHLRRDFDLNNSYPYYKMLLRQKHGSIDSWAIRFYLSIFLNNGLVLYPKKSMIWNSGFDKSGIHTKYGVSQGKLDDQFIVSKFPKNIIIDELNKKKTINYFKIQNNILVKTPRIIIEKIKQYV